MPEQQNIKYNSFWYDDYLRLKNDNNYTKVKSNKNTGGLLAIHKEHNFDPTIGKFGIPRGDYEKIASEVLYNYGRKIILGSENTKYGVKASEGTLDGILFDIKGVEGTGKNNIINHFKDVSKKDAEIIVFYYHDKHLFDNDQLKSGHRSYQRNSKSCRIKTVYYIVDGKLYLL